MKRWGLAAVFALAGMPLLAQQVSSVSIAASSARLIAGETMQLQALARNANGIPVTASSFVWSTSASSVATIDGAGNLTTAGLGMADITASFGNVRSTPFRIQVVPLRIEVSPKSTALRVGDSVQLKAVAINKSGEPIPASNIQWNAVNAAGGTANGVNLGSDGVFRTSATGRFLVRAFINYNQGFGYVNQFWGEAEVTVLPPVDYSLTPILISDMGRSSYQLRPRRTFLATSDKGQLAFIGSLEGVNHGVVLWSNGRTSVPVTGGLPGPFATTLTTEILDPAINSQGLVLVRSNLWGSNPSLILITPSGPRWMVTQDASGSGAVNLQSVHSTPYSLSDAPEGEAIFRARFRWAGTPITEQQSGLFLSRNGTVTLLVSPTDSLPGLQSAITFEDQYGLDGAGNAYFRATDGTRRAIFRRDKATGQIRALLALGDSIGGFPVQSLTGGWSLSIGKTGEVVTAVRANNRDLLLRWKNPAATTAPELLWLNGYSSIWGTHATGGTVFSGNPDNSNGLYQWKSGAPQLLVGINRPSSLPEPIADVYSAGVTATGEVFALLAGIEEPWMLVRFSGNRGTVVLDTGTRVPVEAPLAFTSGVTGDRTGGLMLSMGGDRWSLFDVGPRGLLPRLVIGDRLPSGLLFTGDWNPRRAPDGSVYFMGAPGLHRMDSTGVTLVQRFNTQYPDGVIAFGPGAYLPNSNGQVLINGGTAQGMSRLGILADGKLSLVANGSGNANFVTRLPNGGTIDLWTDLAFDDQGRVMANLRVAGGTNGLYLFRNGQWEPSCLIGSCRINGETVSGVGGLRGAGNYFAAQLTTGSRNHLARWENNDWSVVLASGDRLPSGSTGNNFFSIMDLNRKGDIAFVAGDAGNNLFVYTAQGVKVVQNQSLPLPGGNILRNFMFADLKDDGRVFFTGMDSFERVWAYAAEPRQ